MSDKQRPEPLNNFGIVRAFESLLDLQQRTKSLDAAVSKAEKDSADNSAAIEEAKDVIAHQIALRGRRPMVVALDRGVSAFAELPDPLSDEEVRVVFTHQISCP